MIGTWVKVCGLRTRHDVEVAVEAGADAVGFVLFEASPRHVTVPEMFALGDGIPALRFLLTVDATPDQVLVSARLAGVDGVQPHGMHSAEAAAAGVGAGYFVLHPLAAEPGIDFSSIPDDQVPLIDSRIPDFHGGTGVAFDWNLVPTTDRRFVLAGGLNPDNVGKAIASVSPWGVDASSGLESSPGEKDPALIARFVKRAKQA